MHEEIELKLEVPPEGLGRLRRHPLIRDTRQGRGSTRTLTTIYFDTPERHLVRAGMALRLRREGRGWVQTLKTRGIAGAGHFHRYEWDTPLSAPRLDLAALDATPARELIALPAVAGSLGPLFTTSFRRTTWRLAGGGADDPWAVDLTLDQGTIDLGEDGAGGTVPLCELELELRAGAPRHLYALARTLAEGVPMRIAVASKAERGHALADGVRPAPVKAAAPPLDPAMSVAQAVRLIGHAGLHHLAANQRVLLETRDPEAIHQMRVALRRLRSMLTLFKTVTTTAESAAIKDGLRWLTGELGDARDLDVFLDEVVAPVAAALPATPGLSALIGEFTGRRGDAYVRAIAAAASARCTALTLDLAAWLEGGDWLRPPAGDTAGETPAEASRHLTQPIPAFARRLLDKHRARVLRLGADFAHLDPVSRHQLRIQIKKLRYAAEFFSTLFPDKRVKAFGRVLADLQDHLGALNDGAVAHGLLHAAALPEAEPPAAVEPGGDGERIFAAGLVAGWQEHRATGHQEAAAQAWKAFTRTRPFWD